MLVTNKIASVVPGLKTGSAAVHADVGQGYAMADRFGGRGIPTAINALRQQTASHEQALLLTMGSNIGVALHRVHLAIAKSIGDSK